MDPMKIRSDLVAHVAAHRPELINHPKDLTEICDTLYEYIVSNKTTTQEFSELSLVPSLDSNDPRIPEYKEHLKERGFDDTETWNLDKTIAKFVLPRLKRFQEVSKAYPGSMTEEEWQEKVSKMIKAFELLSDDEWLSEDEELEVRKGMKCFCKHFRSLWW